jgi:hypothetical protein
VKDAISTHTVALGASLSCGAVVVIVNANIGCGTIIVKAIGDGTMAPQGLACCSVLDIIGAGTVAGR